MRDHIALTRTGGYHYDTQARRFLRFDRFLQQPNDANPTPLDPNFKGSVDVTTDDEGRYHLKTIKPGSYDVAAIAGMRPDALALPIARAEGLSRLLVTCDEGNTASLKVIVANGGVPAGSTAHPTIAGKRKLGFWVNTNA